jgi:hypothetical protein
MKLKFRCPLEYELLIPRPIPAVLGLPDWYKAMPQQSFNPVANKEEFTVKKCPPCRPMKLFRQLSASREAAENCAVHGRPLHWRNGHAAAG